VSQLGSGTPLQRSFDQIQRSTTRPIPQAPPPPVARPGDVWVPDRFVSDPINGRMILVPGHSERTLPGGQLQTPPITICRDSTGTCATYPAGTYPDPRQNP
jgi:hypothetical protein